VLQIFYLAALFLYVFSNENIPSLGIIPSR
jgi:hypothetical protein